MRVPRPDLRALVGGETIVAFVPRGAVDEGAEVDLEIGDDRSGGKLKPAYRRWSGDRTDLGGPWSAVVEAVHPSALLDPVGGAARHVLSAVPEGDLLVLRVWGPDGPVLSETAFGARRRSLEGALTT